MPERASYTDTGWAPIGYVAGRVNRDPSTLRRWWREGHLEGRRLRREEGGRPVLCLRVPDARAVASGTRDEADA